MKKKLMAIHQVKKTTVLALFIVVILQSCNPRIRTHLTQETFKPVDKNTAIILLNPDEKVPDKSLFIGDLKIGDTGFSTQCGYSNVMNSAKESARKSGANIIHFLKIKKPNLGSSCYRIKAKLYRNFNSEIVTKLSEKRNVVSKSRLPSNANYAMIYFYRPKSMTGSIIGYKIRMDDGIMLGKIGNGDTLKYKITTFGKHKFWAKTESKNEVIIAIKKGQEYFVRCGIKPGVAIGEPDFYVVKNGLGISEYNSLLKK